MFRFIKKKRKWIYEQRKAFDHYVFKQGRKSLKGFVPQGKLASKYVLASSMHQLQEEGCFNRRCGYTVLLVFVLRYWYQ